MLPSYQLAAFAPISSAGPFRAAPASSEAAQAQPARDGRVGASPRTSAICASCTGLPIRPSATGLWPSPGRVISAPGGSSSIFPTRPNVGLEADATSISQYESDIVPGLLQVEGQACVIFEADDPCLIPQR
jgi:hypothetical protein